MNELNNMIDLNSKKLDHMNNIQDELDKLDRSLNECIDIVYSSIGNVKTKEKLAKMKDDNINSSIKVNNELDNNINETRNELNRLLKEKDKREKEEEDE